MSNAEQLAEALRIGINALSQPGSRYECQAREVHAVVVMHEALAAYEAGAKPAEPVPVEAIREVIRISDRNHNAWNAVKSWLAAAPAAPAPLTEERRHEIRGTGGLEVLELAKLWAANKVHTYQVVNEAEKIIDAAVDRAIAARKEKA